jgi:hypothetical protein
VEKVKSELRQWLKYKGIVNHKKRYSLKDS